MCVKKLYAVNIDEWQSITEMDPHIRAELKSLQDAGAPISELSDINTEAQLRDLSRRYN